MLAPVGLATGLAGGAGAAPRGVVSAAGATRPFSRRNFGTVGVYDIDWLARPEFARLLDNLAASPGAFHGVRFFGAFTAGQLEEFKPGGGGLVWTNPDAPPDFTQPFNAFEALTTRGLTPFVSLGFFPSAVSDSPVAPPASWERWERLVTAFFNALSVDARFGAEAIATWWFEVWNEPDEGRFWSGTIDDYLELYRATSRAIDATGLTVRLGGPAIAYKPEAVPTDGAPWFDRFLQMLASDRGIRCDFLSLHRKGTVTDDPPDPRRLLDAAQATAAQALAIDRNRFAGVTIVNDEADEKVGFEVPYAPRMDQRNAAWLAASMAMHATLEDAFQNDKIVFAAFADNADLQLVRAPFDGRRSIMTRATASSTVDLLKVPAYGFYELLRLLGDRRLPARPGDDRFFPATGLHHLDTRSDDALSILLTYYPGPKERAERVKTIDYAIEGIPWGRINVACFQIDGTLSNGYAAAGGSASNPFPVPDPADLPAIRRAQEIALTRPIARNVAVEDQRYCESLTLAPFTTLCLWLTPTRPDSPAMPAWIDIVEEEGDVILRWAPNREPFFFSYELFVMNDAASPERITPDPLRSALWVDTGPPPGARIYGLRSVSASGAASEMVLGTRS